MTDPKPPFTEAMVEIGCLALYVGLNWTALSEAQREVRREDVRRVYRALADSGFVILPRELLQTWVDDLDGPFSSNVRHNCLRAMRDAAGGKDSV